MAGAVRGPLEWIPGDSRVPWLLGFGAIFTVAFVVSYGGLLQGLSWAGSAAGSPRMTFVVQLAALGISINPVLLWAFRVPMPASRLGVSPDGVVVDHGLRSDAWPWSRAILRGTRLEVVSTRFDVVTRFALTPYQARRVADLRPANA